MLFAVLMGVAVRGADQCTGLGDAACIMQSGCWYDNTNGCGSECVDMGIPDMFKIWFPTCDKLCTDPMLVLASEMFCAKTCGLCPDPPTMPPTEEPTQEVGFVKSHEQCSRQELQNEIEQAIYEMINNPNGGSMDVRMAAVQPCLRMRSHLAYILDMNDNLVGTPNGLLVCDCLNHFTDEEWLQTHLNCEIAGFHVYDLQNECADIGGYDFQECDIPEIEAAMSSKPACSNFGTDIATYGSFAFNPMSTCECVDSFDAVEAAKVFNCMQGGKHLMELYTDECPATINPCDRAAITEAITNEIIDSRRIATMADVCTNMGNHFTTILDSETDTLKDGAYADFALICQCLSHFSLDFVNEHLRCGLGGHDAYSVWIQCAEHTPRCEDMGCELCESKLRCSMNSNGQCMTSCPADGTCFDDPSVNLTCDDLN